MRLCVAGSRTFTNYTIMEQVLDSFLLDRKNVQIVSGGARGADSLADKYAFEHKLDFTLFTANWDLYGSSAGHRRNKEMAEYSDVFILFWDGVSRGTKNMHDNIIKLKKELTVYDFNGKIKSNTKDIELIFDWIKE